MRRLLLIAAIVLAAPGTAGAAEAPYESRLVRLAEVLGAIHYLRNLCGESGDTWRSRMEDLLETENPDPERRARLVASFNHGYRAFDGIYASCTESAIAAIARYMDEGETLSREIVTQYGD